ncbi:hypothetical protein SAMN05216377_1451 [Pseudonocardia oroxyli]|uniref:Uncharacterized protein n=2 Tax=Pseudonocardia oroxyli TaxID=366584 RepID=A0A1G8EV97_PSEOR|nr:hypothetical protein SAMN05216377_1451 [Pseudonocardia oroxyli]
MPRGVPHSVKVVSKQFIGLGVSSPGGTFDGIVLDLASLREQGTEITPEILEAVRNQHGFYVDRASS